MVKLELRYGLLFCQVILAYNGKSLVLDDVLVDTGSGGSVFTMDKLDQLGIRYHRNNLWHRRLRVCL
jgi:hypothetical protein